MQEKTSINTAENTTTCEDICNMLCHRFTCKFCFHERFLHTHSSKNPIVVFLLYRNDAGDTEDQSEEQHCNGNHSNYF